MQLYRYLFFIIYSRWYKKDKDVFLATFSTLIELSIYLGTNLVSIVMNSAFWFGILIPGAKAQKSELVIGGSSLMIVFYFIHYFLLVYKGRREENLNEFENMSKKELMPLKLYVALYAFSSLILLIGLPVLYYSFFDN